MSASVQTITCDQAIFTSVRTPMGEGYRIIAASPGLKPDERQEITRNSPSHGALCHSVDPSTDQPDAAAASNAAVAPSADVDAPGGPFAISFYPLSSGRLCVGLSLSAGAEHTGRGGERVYTQVVVVDADAFARCGYSPFVVARAMIETGLTEPQLKPPPKLPEISLSVSDAGSAWSPGFGPVGDAYCVPVLEQLIEQGLLVVHAPTGWIEAAEAFWLSLPGPLRTRLSMSAGLKFASSRSYHLQLLADEKGAARTRITGTRARYVDTTAETPVEPVGVEASSAWTTFVKRHWSRKDWDGLARRTSLPFVDVAPTGRQRIGNLYNTLDELPSYQSMRLLTVASEHLERESACRVERGIVSDLLNATRHTLGFRFDRITWPADEPLWRGIVRLWRQGERGVAFADPLVTACLRGVSAVDPPGAAEAVLDVAADPPEGADREALQAGVLAVLARWADAVDRVVASSSTDADPDPRIARSRDLVERWKHLRPDCDIIKRVAERCDEALAHGCTAKG